MADFYLDERPKDMEYTHDSGNSGGVQSHRPDIVYTTNGGSSLEPPTPDDVLSKPILPSEVWHLVIGYNQQIPQLLLDGDEWMLSCGGFLLLGVESCMTFEVLCQISGDDSGNHVRCVLLAVSLDEAESDSDILTNFFSGLALPNGTLKIKARWQEGHWNYQNLHTVRFKINEVITPWMKLPLMGAYIDVFYLTILNGQIAKVTARS